MDDIQTRDKASQTERMPGAPADTGDAPDPRHRQVGPESEVRGGPEAPADQPLPRPAADG